MIQTDTYLSQSDEQREAPSGQFIRTSLKQGGLKISLSNQHSSELLKFWSWVIFSRCLLLLASPPLLKCIDQDLHQFEDILCTIFQAFPSLKYIYAWTDCHWLKSVAYTNCYVDNIDMESLVISMWRVLDQSW